MELTGATRSTHLGERIVVPIEEALSMKDFQSL